MTDAPAPWWSSGADDLDDVADPFEAHRSARTGGSSDERGDEPPAQRSILEDGVQALARLVGSSRAGRSGVRPHGRDEACRGCPWCLAVRSLEGAHPEVVDHLDEALHHLVLAAQAWVDAAEEDRARG